MTWVAVAVGGVALVTWGVDKYSDEQDEKNRPKYEIPEEVKQNLTQAQQQSLQGLPEEQKQQYLSNLQRGSAQALAASQSRKGGLSGIAGINQQQNDAYGALLTQDANARFRNKDVLMNQRQNMADYKDQAFQFNKVNPFYEQIKAREERNSRLAQGTTDAVGMYGQSSGGKQYSGSEAPPSNLNSDLSLQKTQGYNQNTGLTNPSMANQKATQYGTMNTDTELTNPYRKQSQNPYTNPYASY